MVQRHTKSESLNELMDCGFSESTMKDMEDYCNREKEMKLKKSKSILLWLKFYKEWFKMSVDLKNAFVFFGERLPGYGVVLIPRKLSVTQCLVLLRDKLGVSVGGEIIANAEDVPMVRRKKETYIVYVQYKDQHGYLGGYRHGILHRINCKPIELILINLFELYSTGKKIDAFNGDPDLMISSFLYCNQ